MDKLVSIDYDYQMRCNFNKFAEFRAQNRYCDISLLVEDREIQAHKLVLAAGSEYFEKEIIGDVSPASASVAERHLQPIATLEITYPISYERLLAVVNFLYTGNLECRYEDAMLFLEIFNDLGIECEAVLKQFINNGNCFQVFEIKERSCGASFKKAACSHIAYNLDNLYTTAGFKNLSKDELLYILSLTTEIDIESIVIFRSITEWVEHDVDNRTQHVDELFNLMRFYDLNVYHAREFILASKTLRHSSIGCKHLMEATKHGDCGVKLKIVLDPKLYVFSRGSDTTMYTVSCVDFRRDHDDFNVARSNRPALDSFSMTKYKNIIYAVGGKRDNKLVNVGLKFETEGREWTEFSCPIRKVNCGVCTMKTGKMFILGGMAANESQRSCMSYDYETGQLVQLPNMTNARRNPGVSVCESSLYVLGGNSYGYQPLVERYDPREGVWENAGILPIYKGTVSASVGHNVFNMQIGGQDLLSYDTRTTKYTRVLNVKDNFLRDFRCEWMVSGPGLLYVLHKEGITIVYTEFLGFDIISTSTFPGNSILVT